MELLNVLQQFAMLGINCQSQGWRALSSVSLWAGFFLWVRCAKPAEMCQL